MRSSVLASLHQVAFDRRLAERLHRLEPVQALDQNEPVAVGTDLDRDRLAVLQNALGDLADLSMSSVLARFTGTWISTI